MGTKSSPGGAETLFGQTRLAVLALFFTNPDRQFYLRQITRTIKSGQGAAQRELKRLTDSGILLKTRKGRQVFYQANRHNPVFNELKTLLIKTSGVADLLRQALSKYTDKIRMAFIFGSFASSSEHAQSDVDLAVIGDISFGEVVSSLSEVQEILSREINPVVYSENEFRAKVTLSHFARSLKDSDKIFLIGSADEFERLVK